MQRHEWSSCKKPTGKPPKPGIRTCDLAHARRCASEWPTLLAAQQAGSCCTAAGLKYTAGTAGGGSIRPSKRLHGSALQLTLLPLGFLPTETVSTRNYGKLREFAHKKREGSEHHTRAHTAVPVYRSTVAHIQRPAPHSTRFAHTVRRGELFFWRLNATFALGGRFFRHLGSEYRAKLIFF